MKQNSTKILLLILGLFAAMAGFSQTYVTVKGAGDSTGTSWENAFPADSLQRAFDKEQGEGSIYIAEGHYYLNKTITVKGYLMVSGGYDSTLTESNQRQIGKHRTYFDGGFDPNNLIKNLVYVGGASDVTFDNITFTNSNNNAGNGSAIIVDAQTKVRLSYCEISNTRAKIGAAVYLKGTRTYKNTLTLLNCLMYNNQSSNVDTAIQVGVNDANISFSTIENIAANKDSATIDLSSSLLYKANEIPTWFTGIASLCKANQLLFVDEAKNDFRLQSTSPAINIYDGSSDFTYDFAGRSRSAGAGFDAGAFEYGTVQGNCLNFNYEGADTLHTTIDSLGEQNFTIETWFKANDMVTDVNLVTNNTKKYSNKNYLLRIRDNKLLVSLNTYNDTLWSTKAVNDDAWHHVALVRNDTMLYLYLDGQLNKFDTIQSANLSATAQDSLSIGDKLSYNPLYLDELRIWNKALDLTAIRANLHDTIAANTQNLLAYYRFDETESNGTVLFAEKGSDIKVANAAWSYSQALVTPFINSYTFNKTNDSVLVKWDSIPNATEYGLVHTQNEGFDGEETNYFPTNSALVPFNWIDTARTVAVNSASLFDETDFGSSVRIYRNELPFLHNAVSLTGGDGGSYISISHKDTLNLVDSLTIEAWIYPRTTSKLAGIVSKYTVNQLNAYAFRLGGETAPYANLDFNNSKTAPGTIVTDKWQHVAVTYNRGSVTFYINGKKQVTYGSTSSLANNTSAINIGHDYLGSDRFFDGEIDEVRIWNYARTQDDIVAYKNKELKGTEKGLLAYYQMNNSFGRKVIDKSGNNNTGVITRDENDIEQTPWVESGAMRVPSIRFVARTDSSINVAWDSVVGVKEYIISGSEDSKVIADFKYEFTHLRPKTNYWIKLKVVFEDESSETDSVLVKTARVYAKYAVTKDTTLTVPYNTELVRLPVTKTSADTIRGLVGSDFVRQYNNVEIKMPADSIDVPIDGTRGLTKQTVWLATNEWSKKLDSAKIFHYTFEDETFAADQMAQYQDSIHQTQVFNEGEGMAVPPSEAASAATNNAPLAAPFENGSFSRNNYGFMAYELQNGLALSEVSFPFDTATVNLRFSLDSARYAQSPVSVSLFLMEPYNTFSQGIKNYQSAVYEPANKELSVLWKIIGIEKPFIDSLKISNINLLDNRSHSLAIVRQDTLLQVWLDGELKQTKYSDTLPLIGLSQNSIVLFGVNKVKTEGPPIFEPIAGSLDEIYVSSVADTVAADIALLGGIKKTMLTVKVEPKATPQLAALKPLAFDTLYVAKGKTFTDSAYFNNIGAASFFIDSIVGSQATAKTDNLIASNSTTAVPLGISLDSSRKVKDTALVYTTAPALDTNKLLVYLSFDNSFRAQTSTITSNMTGNNFDYSSDRFDRYSAINLYNDSFNANTAVTVDTANTKLDSAFTIAFSFKIENNQYANTPFLFSKGVANEGGIYSSIKFNNNRDSVFLYSSFGMVSFPRTDNWMHIAYCVDTVEGIAKTYLNGALALTSNIEGATAFDTTTFYTPIIDSVNKAALFVGSMIDGNDAFNGAMDEFVMYNRSLSASEVAALNGIYALPVNAVVLPDSLFVLQPKDTAVCEGQKVVLKAKAVAAATKYQWYSVNGDVYTLLRKENDSLLIIDSAKSTNQYYCIVETPYGARDTSKTVKVTVNANPKITLLKDSSLCKVVTIKAVTEEQRIVWNTSETTPSISTTKSGVFTVTITGANKCFTSATATVHVPEPYQKTITDTVCSSYTFGKQRITKTGIYTDSLVNYRGCDSVITLKLTVLSSITAKPSGSFMTNKSIIQPTDTVRYLSTTQKADSLIWTFEGGQPAISNDANPLVTYTKPGRYKASLRLINCNGDTTINMAKPINVWAISPRDTMVCANTVLNLGVAGNNFTAYKWDVQNATTASISVRPKTTTTYHVTMSRGAIKITDSITVIVHSTPDLGPDTAFCAGTSFKLKVGKFAHYYWNGSTKEGSNTLTVSTEGTYTVKTIDTNNCVATDTMLVKPLYLSPVVDLGNDTTICWKTKHVLSAGEAASYLWSTKATTQSITVDTTGTYMVIATSNHGCKAAGSITITANAPKPQEIGIVTPSSTGKNIVAWQRKLKSNYAAFLVEKESDNANQFVPFKTLNASDSSLAIDKVSNFNVKQEAYRLITTDSCGNKSAPSTVHRTMYLSAFLRADKLISVEWQKYEGIAVAEYIIYRAKKGEPLAEYKRVAATDKKTQIYIDNEALGLNSYYQVGFEIATPINVGLFKSDTGPFSQSFSNMSEASLVASPELSAAVSVSVQPNPSNGQFSVSSLDGVTTITKLQIVDELGKTVLQPAVNGTPRVEVNASNLAAGVYTISIETSIGNEQQRIVIY